MTMLFCLNEAVLLSSNNIGYSAVRALASAGYSTVESVICLIGDPGRELSR